jgi:hypothetical protein
VNSNQITINRVAAFLIVIDGASELFGNSTRGGGPLSRLTSASYMIGSTRRVK